MSTIYQLSVLSAMLERLALPFENSGSCELLDFEMKGRQQIRTFIADASLSLSLLITKHNMASKKDLEIKSSWVNDPK